MVKKHTAQIIHQQKIGACRTNANLVLFIFFYIQIGLLQELRTLLDQMLYTIQFVPNLIIRHKRNLMHIQVCIRMQSLILLHHLGYQRRCFPACHVPDEVHFCRAKLILSQGLGFIQLQCVFYIQVLINAEKQCRIQSVNRIPTIYTSSKRSNVLHLRRQFRGNRSCIEFSRRFNCAIDVFLFFFCNLS